MVATKSPTVTDGEIAERVQVLTRLRALLQIQREKFRTYLHTLEDEGDAIRRGDVDRFEAHVQLEQSIVRDIISFRRAVDPLEAVYHRLIPDSDGVGSDIPQLRAHLDHLQEQILKRNDENRYELRNRMDEIRQQVEQLKIPNRKRSVYAGAQTAGMVDIST
jgi:hypothetical protein